MGTARRECFRGVLVEAVVFAVRGRRRAAEKPSVGLFGRPSGSPPRKDCRSRVWQRRVSEREPDRDPTGPQFPQNDHRERRATFGASASPAATSSETMSASRKGELGSRGFQIEVTALAWAVTVAEHRGRLYDSESSLVR